MELRTPSVEESVVSEGVQVRGGVDVNEEICIVITSEAQECWTRRDMFVSVEVC